VYNKFYLKKEKAMPEMRRNPLTGKWVILAPERAQRPQTPTPPGCHHHPHMERHHECQFCYGNERNTPEELLVYGRKNGKPNTNGWDLRVISNKFPAVDMNSHFSVCQINEMEVFSYAEGKSEVVIETPHHSKAMSNYTLKEIELVLRSYKDRYIAISKEEHIKYIALFKNHGKNAGASIAHSHSQIIGVPVIPPILEQELALSEKHFKTSGSCIYCDMTALESEQKSRIIAENDDFIAFMPYASKAPYETWVLPKFHCSCYELITNEQIKNLAIIWKIVLYKLSEALENPPYNYFIHTLPVREKANEHYHWHAEIIPRTTTPAGFELGTGIFINISTPEANAERLKDIKVKYSLEIE
jgi:UDPglucose--hexose-1-phosphate uridylyltransferase